MKCATVAACWTTVFLAFPTDQSAWAQPPTPSVLSTKEWKVGEASRKALVHLPTRTEGAPVVFVWHGHGGRMDFSAAAFRIEQSWPDAVVLYPQGLPTVGRVNDPDGKQSGWQFDADQYGDRDLKFFDAMLASLEVDYKVDVRRVFSTGHSNGGRFSHLLWAARPDRVAAVAPVAVPPVERFERLQPKPCLHVAGERDEVARYADQRAGMDRLRTGNGCEIVGRPWGPDGVATYFPSRHKAPFIEYVHPGGHEIPVGAPGMIVACFKEASGG